MNVHHLNRGIYKADIPDVMKRLRECIELLDMAKRRDRMCKTCGKSSRSIFVVSGRTRMVCTNETCGDYMVANAK